jgi:2-oxoglutarate dehydrogenase complex dehydrogenase (E1) component-like enzyme
MGTDLHAPPPPPPQVTSLLDEEFAAAKDYKHQNKDWLANYWAGFNSPAQHSRIRNTGVPMDILKQIGLAITELPPTFAAHKMIKKVYDSRRQMIESGEGVDWAMGEALAYATLVSEGNHVRLSGQDVERGTFSHRHAVTTDQNTGEKYVALAHVYKGQPKEMFTVTNSSLSEYGVLGFELGYSKKKCLRQWARSGTFSDLYGVPNYSSVILSPAATLCDDVPLSKFLSPHPKHVLLLLRNSNVCEAVNAGETGETRGLKRGAWLF